MQLSLYRSIVGPIAVATLPGSAMQQVLETRRKRMRFGPALDPRLSSSGEWQWWFRRE